MMPLIGQLLGFGYTASQILSYVSKKFPELTKGINNAQNQGFDPEKILKFISNKVPVNKRNHDELLNSNDAYMRSVGMHTRQERNENTAKYLKGAIGLGAGVLTTAPFAKKAYDVFTKMQSGAIRPDEIIQTRPEKGLGQASKLGAPPTRLGIEGPQTPQASQDNLPPTEPQSPEQPPTIEMPNEPVTEAEKAFMASEQEVQTLWDMAKSGKRAGGPADEFLKTANKLIKSGDLTDYDTFKQFRKWWKTTEGKGRGKPLVEFELFRNQTSSWTGKPKQDLEMKVGSEVDTPKGRATIQELKNKVATVAFEGGKKGQYDHGKLKPLPKAEPGEREFANALYKAPHESEDEWDQRKTIHSAAKKAANEIMMGKTFLDLPVPEGVSKHYSTAVDVLQFMAGMPNAYNDLLDDDEKQELFEATGMGEMMRPEKLGDRPIHGAQITPNMVWNMLVSVEPKLTTMKRPMSQKKSGALKSGEMGSAEFRRQLTHTVYGILSGKNISTELSDKINKISTAVPILDKLVQSFKTKKLKETEEELERLENDEYFASLFNDELDEMIKRFR